MPAPINSSRNQVVRHRTRIKNEVHSILQTHLIPPCPHADLFGRLGRNWLARQQLPVDERAAIERHLRELDRLGEDLALLDREIAERVIEDPSVKRLLTITGVNINVAAGLVAAMRRVLLTAETRELCRAQSASAPIGSWSGAAWPHQQARPQPRARPAGRLPLSSGAPGSGGCHHSCDR